MSSDSPRIVNLETSLELSEFPSEAEFTSEGASALEPVPAPPTVAPAAAVAVALAEPPAIHPDVAVQPVTLIAAKEAAPAPSIRSIPLVREEPDSSPVVDHPRPLPHLGPATITEFPVKPQIAAAVALPTLPAGPVSLVELIERHGGLDWREAVAVIQQICHYLKEHSLQSPIFLDPRTIQITERGEVHLLSGQTSSDPLVVQVGRLLRTMLMGREAPPELRLLLSQATFELPIFESIDDVDRALGQLNKLDEPGPAGLALLRAVAAPPPPISPELDFDNRPAPIRSILPAHKLAGRRSRTRGGLRELLGSYGSHVAVIFASIAVIGLLLLTRPSMLFPDDALAPARAQAAPAESPNISVAPPVAPEAGPHDAGTSKRPATVRPDSSLRAGTPARDASPHPSSNGPRPGTVASSPTPTAGIVVIPRRSASVGPLPPTAPVSARESERHATSLLAEGKADQASLAFDGLVMSNPLYEPRTTDLTPEALATFRRSQQTILPAKAQQDYDRAKTALASGNTDRALSLAREAIAIIDRHPSGISLDLRQQAEELIDEAHLAAAAANEPIYSESDLDISPPRQLSRQMPLSPPTGVPANRVGWLDMVIGKNGTVFQVKLNTPLNRYHERMIVSAAKAWLFRPATKNGQPVMCRIKVKINLPESGTDF